MFSEKKKKINNEINIYFAKTFLINCVEHTRSSYEFCKQFTSLDE